MENQFDLGLNIASIETELPDPVITLTGADTLTAFDTAEMPLLSLTVHGRSWQNGTPSADNAVPIENINDSGSMIVTTHGENLIDPSTVVIGGMDSATGEEITTGSRLRTGFIYVPYTGERTHIVPDGFVLVSVYRYDLNKNFLGFNYRTEDCYLRFLYKKEDGSVITEEDLTAIRSGLMFSVKANADYEPYKSITAAITTALPLRGVPVSNNGNYTNSSGQEWICDTLDHVYGEPAKVTKRVGLSSLVYKYDMRGGGALTIVKSSGIDYHYIGESGTVYYQNNNWYVDLNGYFRMISYNTETGAIIHDMNTAGQYYTKMPLGDRFLVGNWKNSDGTMYEGEQVLPAYKLSNGSEMPKDYICTTGIPTEGAEIIYPAASETILLTTKETEQLNSLSGYNGSTTVYNDNTAEMTVKLLREDYEMQYIYWIKESQSFICEKSGKYKIICVGGGASGGLAFTETAECLQAVGSTTSFGSIISASGAERSKGSYLASADYGAHAVAGGQSGYDGINYASTACVATGDVISTGGNSSFMWETGHGYGAGGGAHGMTLAGKALTAVSGACGKVESTIVDLEENQAVFCTIGGGGVLNLSDNDVTAYVTSVGAELTVSSGDGAKISACASSGADGVIIVQYLGL